MFFEWTQSFLGERDTINNMILLQENAKFLWGGRNTVPLQGNVDVFQANTKFLRGTQYFCVLMLYVASKCKVLWGNAILLKGNAKTMLLRAISWGMQGNAELLGGKVHLRVNAKLIWRMQYFCERIRSFSGNAMQENAKVSQMQNPWKIFFPPISYFFSMTMSSWGLCIQGCKFRAVKVDSKILF